METVRCCLAVVALCFVISLCVDRALAEADANKCHELDIEDLGLQDDVYLKGFGFSEFLKENMYLCAKQCLYRKKCKSFHYDTANKMCTLNTASSDGNAASMEPKQGMVYADSDGIPQVSYILNRQF